MRELHSFGGFMRELRGQTAGKICWRKHAMMQTDVRVLIRFDKEW